MAETRRSELLAPRRGFAELVALSERRLADAFGGKVARFYAWGIALSYGAVFAFTPGRPSQILAQALITLAWIPGGIVALGAARDQRRLDDESGLVALVRQRGFDERDLEFGRWLAAVRRLGRVMGYPALALGLTLATAARSVEAALASGLALVGTAGFVLCSSLLLASAARAAAVLSGGRGRLTLLGIVLLPQLARSLFPWMPSIPALLADLLAMTVGGSR